MRQILLMGLLTSGLSFSGRAGDTLRLTLPQAEDRFRQYNLQLMAAKLGITENQAYESQARLWNNPTLYVEQMPYNRQTREVMPIRQGNSEQVVQFQQLLLLAGKRQKQLAIARMNTQLATDRFYDLLRSLNYALHSAFFELFYTQQALKVYDQEISTLSQTVTLFQQQYDKGNIPLKDLSRLKAYLFNLTTEQRQLLLKQADAQADLTVLLRLDPTDRVEPLWSEAEINQRTIKHFVLSELLKLANENRFDLKGYQDQALLEKQNLMLQKALAVPDLTLQATYDRNAGYIPNYVGIGLGIPIPVFNRNQGNIRAATIRTESSSQVADAYRLQVESEVQRAWQKVLQTDRQYQVFDQHFNQDFGKLIEGVILNYRKQNIDVVEFLDFFDSYKNTQLQYNQLQNDRMQCLEDLNVATGKALFPY